MLVLAFAAAFAQAAEDRPVVETSLGKVRGVVEDGVAGSGRLLWNYRYRTEKNMFFNRLFGKCQFSNI